MSAATNVFKAIIRRPGKKPKFWPIFIKAGDKEKAVTLIMPLLDGDKPSFRGHVLVAIEKASDREAIQYEEQIEKRIELEKHFRRRLGIQS